jgi:hypothetical protein
MGADEIRRLLKSAEEPPSGWVVFPLLRHKMIMSILGWIGSTLMDNGVAHLCSSNCGSNQL